MLCLVAILMKDAVMSAIFGGLAGAAIAHL